MDSFLTKFLEKNQKEPFKDAFRKQLEECYVNSLNDLITLPASVWTNNLERTLGNLYGPFKREIDSYRKNQKNKSAEERSPAESLADLHKVKRFLLYEAGKKEELKKLGYLNSDALKEGFSEQKKDKHFDGGPILSQIQSSLEQFDKPAIQFVKPSHGMILVSRWNLNYLKYSKYLLFLFN